MGRKPLSDKPMMAALRIRLTVEERALLDRAAGGRPTSAWAREMLLELAIIEAKTENRTAAEISRKATAL